MDKYIGRLLDNRYEILEIIGTGGMAVVYKARCHRLNRLVAIKILKDDYSQDAEFRRRFHAESQAVAMLNHPNIVSVYDVSTQGDADYIVMELVEGITLKQYMERRGGYLNWKESLHFAMQIGRALEHAHNQGIVHRDIKPHNVMILKNGSAKVTDFGIARVMSSQNTLTREALGSVHYISPEQAKGGRVDSRSDIYSLGVVMYEMLTGRPPYDGESPVAVALKHINGGAAMPSTLNPNIPGGLEQIIMRAMSVDPDQRYSTATSMLYDMEEFRKNPNILFLFDGEPQAAPPQTGGAFARPSETPRPPRTAAERVAGAHTGQNRPPQGQTRRPADSAGPRPATQNGRGRAGSQNRPSQTRRPTPPQQEEERMSKGVLIAIIACGGAVLVALIVLIAILAGGDGGPDPILVEVPSFVGESYESLNHRDYPNLVLVDDKYTFDDQIPAGEIISQDPLPREQVEVGTQVKLVISLGVQSDEMPDLVSKSKENAKELMDSLRELGLTIMFEEEFSEDVAPGSVSRTEPAAGDTLTKGEIVTLWISKGPLTLVLEELAGSTETEARTKLGNKEGMNLDIQVQTETSEEVEEGKVIRTEPAAGELVKAGDTVTLIISSGSGIIKTTVPGVTGMDIAKALSILTDYNLKFTYEAVESDKPKDEVLTQSIDKGEVVPEGTVIELTISAGPKETQPTEPQVFQKTVTLVLPADIAVPYLIQVYYRDVPVADPYQVEPGTTEVDINLEGNGVQYFDFYVNGTRVESFRVDFNSEIPERITLNFTVSE